MKFKGFEDWISVLLVFIILISGLSAINYFNSNSLFDAKITYVNNQKAPYSIILEIENKLTVDLDYDIELIYKRADMVLSTDTLSCKSKCETKLSLNQVFFDEYVIVITTVYEGRHYKKELNFIMDKPPAKYSIEIPKDFLWEGGNLEIKGKIYSKENSLERYFVDVFPTNRPDLRQSQEYYCSGVCKIQFNLNSTIIFGEYSVNVYSQTDVVNTKFNVVDKNSFFVNNNSQSIEKIMRDTNEWEGEEDIEIDSCLKYFNDEEKYVTCKKDIKLLESKNFTIQKLPEDIYLGKEFSFEVVINSSVNFSLEDLNLEGKFEIEKNYRFTNKVNSSNIAQATDEDLNVSNWDKILVVKGKLKKSYDTKEFAQRLGVSDTSTFTVSKPIEVLSLESKLGVKIEEYEEDNISLKKNISVSKKEVELKFKDADLNQIKKIEVLDKQTLNWTGKDKEDLKTDILNVDANSFNNTQIIMKKQSFGTISKIMTCSNFTNGTCSTNWVDSNYQFEQNETHLWFNATHFSAYAGVGVGYVFNVDFTDYNPQTIKVNKEENVDINVSCDNTGNCGTINVTLYYYLLNYSYFENFEAGLGNWANTAVGDQRDWTRDSGGTPTGTTGPSIDHTLGTGAGWYMYYETSNPVINGDLAYFLSPTFKVYGTFNFNYWYHMFGANMGPMTVQYLDQGTWTTLWTLTGNQGDVWFNNIHNFKYFGNTQIRIIGNRGGVRSDMAFDDLNITTWGKQLLSTYSTPLYVNSSQMQQVTLNANQNQVISFGLNASGSIGDLVTIYAIAQKSTDATIVSQSLEKNITIADANPPLPTLVSPSNDSTITTVNVTFAGNATDDTALGSATLYVWDELGSIVYTNSVVLSGLSQSFSIDYNFTSAGTYHWNYEVFDSGGNTAFASSNRTLTISIPQASIEYQSFTNPFPIMQNQYRKFKANISCVNGNCGQVNATLYHVLDYIPPYNYLETLETNFGNWTDQGGTCFWIRNQDTTASTGTGPSNDNSNNGGTGFDHTLGTSVGWYAYVEASSNVCQGADLSADLIATNFTAGTNSTTVSFRYHTLGTNVGTLHFDVHNGATWVNDVWTVTGAQQAAQSDPYLQAVIDLSAYSGTINVRIRYDGVTGWSADAAIDDLQISTTNLIEEVFPTTSTLPFWTNSTNPLTISNMNQGDSQLITFYINASGNLWNRSQAYLKTSINPAIGFDYSASKFNFSIEPSSPPVGNKTAPLHLASSVENNQTYNATASAKYGLKEATFYLWDSANTLINTSTYTILDEPLDTNVSFHFDNFTYADTYHWNYKFTDIYGYSSWADNMNWTYKVNNTPPWNNGWTFSGTSGNNYNRTQTLNIWATFFDKLQLASSKLEENGTGSLTNYTKSMSGRTYLQNYTLNLYNTTMFSKVGKIIVKAMHGLDNGGLYSTINSPLINITLYGFSDIAEILPEPAAVGQWGQESLVYCLVADNFTNIAIPNYNVTFYNNISGYLGSNLTDSFGKAYITVNVSEKMNVSCNITQDLSLYYYDGFNTSKWAELNRDQITPWWNSWDLKYVGGGSISNGVQINKTQSIYLHSYWLDNYQLYYAFVEHNASGTKTNYSIEPFPTTLNSNESWGNYTFDFTNGTEFKVGLVNVSALYGSDKADNVNKTTPSHYFYLYGFANISSFTINDTLYGNNSQILITCNVTDNTSLSPIANYPVTISSNQTGIILNSVTNGAGILSTIYTDTTGGTETISCNINPTGYYYTDTSSKSINVTNDIIKPYIISNYALNPSKVHPGETSVLTGLWNEPIYSADIYTDKGNFVVTTYANNWTNGTITTDLSWAVGAHNASFINILDEQGNLNLTTNNLTLDFYHYANVTAQTISATEIYLGDSITSTCQVKDTDLNSIISGYNVSFYENGVYFNSSLTDGTGWASVGYTPSSSGNKNVLCNISTDTTNYYDPVIGGAESTKVLSVISLSGRACSGDTMTVAYNNYFDSALMDGYYLSEAPNCVTGTDTTFAQWLTKVTQRADNYGAYTTTGADFTAIHSDGTLDAGPRLRLRCRNGASIRNSYPHLYENVNPASLIGFKVLYYYAAASPLDTVSSPNVVSLFLYNADQNTINSSAYINQTFTPLTSACTGQNPAAGATAYYQELNAYNLLPKIISQSLPTIDMRMSIFTQSNYDGSNNMAEYYFNEFELYTKVLTVDMISPVATTESYVNKTEQLTCVVPTSGTNTSNVDLYPQFCSGTGCSAFTNIQNSSDALRVNQSTFACSSSFCTKTFYINYSQEGNYSLRCNATNFDSYNAVSTAQDLIVYQADLEIKDISHDYNSLDEYEVGDNIKHINVSVYNTYRGKAYFANYTTTIINSSGTKPSWLASFPQTKICTNPMDKGTYCNTNYNNFGAGHSIPTTAVEDDYNISVNLLWANVGDVTNSSKSFKIWDLRTKFESYFLRNITKQNWDNTLTFNMSNPWNGTLTNVNITVNCPIHLTCLGSSGTSHTYATLTSGNSISSIFNISSTYNTPPGIYNFTFTVKYTNPRGFTKTWTNQGFVQLDLRKSTYLTLIKDINNVGSNLYLLDFFITNHVNATQDLLIADYVNTKLTPGSFNPVADLIDIIFGPKYVDRVYGWNLTVNPLSTNQINYSITSATDYNLLDVFMLGLD